MILVRFGWALRNFTRREAFVKIWVLPAWIGLGLASAAISVASFRRIAPHLGHLHHTTKPRLSPTLDQGVRAQQIGRTVQLAARFVPWRAGCYPQAIVARMMLGLWNIPFTLCMGVRRNVETCAMEAHAWVQCEDICVTGGNGDVNYSTVAVFSNVKVENQSLE